MESKKAYRYRIYPDNKRQQLLNEQMWLSHTFYNKLLERTIKEYINDKKSKISRKIFNGYMKDIIQEDKRFLKIYSQTRQDIRDRLIKAYQNFFKRVQRRKKGEKIKVGFPRFRSIDKYKSFAYPQDNGSFHIEKNMLRISRIGRMKIELHRQIQGTIKTLTIKKEANQYYAIFTTLQEAEIPKVENIKPIGIDVGLTTFASFSDGTTIRKPKFARKNEKRLHHWERIKARRQKGSRNREKAKFKIQEIWQDITNQNKDFIEKETTKLINSDYTSFVMEDLEIRNMMKNHKYARSIQEATWGMFRQILSCKAESAGMKVIPVPYQYTTQACSRCHNVKKEEDKMTLNDRIYNCNVCGLVMDRDENASTNILNRATAGHAGSNASGDATSTIQQVSQVVSLKQEHTLLIAEEAHML
jgi:putative transposase